MRAVVQRVNRAAVFVDGSVAAAIAGGFLVLLGVGGGDDAADCQYLADKIAHLRVFPDDGGRMNRSIQDVGGEILVVSQFTLYGDCRRGRRPSFSAAAAPEAATALYEEFLRRLRLHGVTVREGVFQAHMQVELVNDGPVTLLLESKGAF